jgi:hypothetical protein
MIKTLKKKTLVILCAIALIATITTVLAASYYTQTITWTKGTTTIAVTNSNAKDLGVLDLTSPYIETRTYTVANTGTLAATVYAHTSGANFTASWSKLSAIIAPATTTTFVLTLTITDTGSCTVTFTDIP